MKNFIYIDYGLTTYCADNKIIKQLGLYYKVKAMFNHSIIYNYTPQKLAKLTGLHQKTIERYVKKLHDHKFVEFRDGHLLFVRPLRIELDCARGIKRIPIRPYTSYKSILRRIYYIILINNKQKQLFRIASNYGTKVEELNEKAQKKAIKQAKLIGRSLENSREPIVSTTSAQRLFGVSRTTARKILNDLKERNYLTFQQVIHRIGVAGNLKYVSGLGHFYNQYGSMYQYLGQSIKTGNYMITL